MSTPPTDTQTDSLRLMWRVRDLRDERVGTTQKAVLFALVSFREEDGTIRPSVAQLARAVDLSPKQARRVLHALEQLGLVEIEVQPPQGRRLIPNAYRLVLPSTGVLPQKDVLPGDQEDPSHGRERGTPSDGSGVLPPVGASEDLSEDLSEDQEPPSARACEDSMQGPPPAEPGPRPFHVRRAEQPFFTAAFAQGVSSVTLGAYAVPRDELAALDDAIDAHAPREDAFGAREAWVRETAAEYRRAIWGREQYHRGGGPRGWLEWLNQGGPNAQWLAMSPAEREAFAEDQRRRDRAEARRRAERVRERREAIEDAPPVSASTVAGDLEKLFGPASAHPGASADDDRVAGAA